VSITPAKLQAAQRMIESGQLDQARAALLKLAQAPGGTSDRNLISMLAYVLGRRGEYDKARYYLDLGLRAAPQDGMLLTNLGRLLTETGQTEEAIGVLERAVEAAPSLDGAWLNLTSALLGRRRYAAAIAWARRALERFPGHLMLLRNLCVALLNSGRPEEAVETAQRLVAAEPGSPAAASLLAYTLNFMPGVSPQELLRAHRAYGTILQRLRPNVPPPPAPGPADAERPLRVGMIGGDFFTHSVAFFVEPLLEHRDRAPGGVHITLYHTATNTDATTERFKALADRWRHAAWMREAELVGQIRADGIDVLIDLAGHTANTRLPILHLRPAPLQMTYCGYPATTGVAAVDVRIVDSLTDPAPEADAAAVERLARLDPCFLCYRPVQAPPDGRVPDPSPPPSAGGGPVTFGSFNALSKLNDRLVGVWRRLLDEVPGSRLLLKSVGLSEEEVRQDVAARFERAGIGPDRLELVASVPTLLEHLALYSKIDIGLDHFPYAGTTTTCEALYMGVPVVTLACEPGIHAGRVGASLLGAVGLSELVAHSEDEYIRLAADLARDRERLTALRSGLRDRLLASPLCDAAGFSGRFWRLVRDLWRERCQGGPDRPGVPPA